MNGLDLSELNSQQISNVADITTGFNTANASLNNGPDVGNSLNNSDAYKDFCVKFDLNEEQLAKLLELCKKNGIDVFDESAQKQVNELINNIKLETSKTSETSEIQEIKTETPEPQKATGVSHAEFVKLSKEQKVEVLVQELAKNKFLYGDSDNRKTEEDWNALSEEDR
ncbi:hypothetical protein J6P92_05410, partial [bacterium]|nr:hypothetical protein [bacterium]